MSERAAVRMLAGLAVAALVLGACGSAAPRATSTSDEADTAQTPEPRRRDDDRPGTGSRSKRPAPEHDFSVTTFAGDAFRLSDHLGTPVVINFWESW